jgi:MerR family transcriptional regulator, light-induced transcriptional regulator
VGLPDGADDSVERFERALTTTDQTGAVAVVTELLAAGADPLAVLVDLIAAGQRRVGTRWQRNEWTVAEEHAATAIAMAATEAVGRHVRDTVPVTRGRVVAACAEREWHELPSMIIGYAFRAAGWDVTLLGAATQPQRFSRHLHDLGPDVTAVSCSVLGALPTTRRLVESSTTAGIPIMVGGPAFGVDGLRAGAIGATAWAPTARHAVEAIGALPTVVDPAPPLPDEAATEQAAIELAAGRLAERLRRDWSLAARLLPTSDDSVDGLPPVTGDAVALALHAVSACLLTGDPRPLPETAAWLADVLAARDADPVLVAELGEQLAAALGDYPLARDLVRGHWAAGLSALGPAGR